MGLLDKVMSADVGGIVAKGDEMLEGMDPGSGFSLTALIDQKVNEMVDKKPELAKEFYLQKHELLKSASADEIAILKESIASEMSVKEKVGLLMHMWFGGVWGQVSEDMIKSGDIKVAQKTIAEKMDDFKDSKFVVVDGTNLILPSNGGMFGQARKLFGMVTPFLGKDADGNDRFELLTGATVVFPRVEEGKNVFGAKAAMNFEAMGKGLKPPVKVEVVSPLDVSAGSKPPDNVLRIMYAPREGLPMKGGQLDLDVLRAFANVYIGGETMWFAPEIVAGLKVLGGAKPEAALAFVRIKNNVENYAPLLADLGRLQTQLQGGQPAPASASLAEAIPAAPVNPATPAEVAPAAPAVAVADVPPVAPAPAPAEPGVQAPMPPSSPA